MKLTKVQIEKLWGETGPYSEAHLTIETRILDDFVSRIFLSIDVHINPLTFEIIKDNRELFRDDPRIQQLLDFSEYRGLSFGYVSNAFLKEYSDEKVMKEARKAVERCKDVIFIMHKLILELLNEKPKVRS